MSTPLNPNLFARLQAIFERVLISSPGEQQVGHLEFGATLQKKWIVSAPGEYYCVACPYCEQVPGNGPDHGHHLWINHTFGSVAPGTKDNRTWLANCFRGGCMSSARKARGFENAKDLHTKIFKDIGGCTPAKPHEILPGTVRPPDATVTLPGQCLRVDQLPADHHAVGYLRGRGFDPKVLAEWWNIHYCVYCHEHWQAVGRIIIPQYDHRGQLVAWQGRLVGEHPTAPKYCNAAGLHPRRHLYGAWHANAWPYLLVVEGPTNVWRCGPGTVGLLGTIPTGEQIAAIEWLTVGTGKPVLIALDGRAFRPDGSVKSDTTEAAQGLCRRLRRDGIQVEIIPLPDGADPDSIGYGDMQQLIAWGLREIEHRRTRQSRKYG